jgi:hypothetical protein
MRQFLSALIAGMLACTTTARAQTIPVDRFDKVIISPYIQATFVQGDQETVTINGIIVDSSKLHVEVSHGTLRLYLDGAKDIPKNQQEYRNDGNWQNHHLYPNHAVIATITYKKLNTISLRGEETFLCQSPLSARRFTLRVYGDSKVIFTEAHIAKMHTTIYGDGSVELRSGEVIKQVYTSYGDGKVNTTAVTGHSARMTSFGQSEFRVNVSDRIKITSFGEAKVRYMGNPAIVKGIHIGGVDVQKLD